MEDYRSSPGAPPFEKSTIDIALIAHQQCFFLQYIILQVEKSSFLSHLQIAAVADNVEKA